MMNKGILVSIIIPVYNAEDFIEAAINSCINQTWKNIEIIAVDDGSTDNSFSILKDISDKFDNIRVLQQSNKGACAARNFGIREANGDYLQFLDSDDILISDKLERQLKLSKDEKVITFCNTINFKGKDINNIISKTTKPQTLRLLELISQHYIFTPTVLLKKDTFFKNGFYDEKLKRAQEHEFHVRLSSRGYVFKNLNFEGVMVRHHNSKDRISNKDISGSEDNDIYLLELFEQHINSFKSGSKQIILKLYTELFNLAIYKAQQHGNKRNFIGVKLIEQYMKQTKHYEEYNFVYKKSAVYNLLLRRLGLNKFEQLRSVISMFKT